MSKRSFPGEYHPGRKKGEGPNRPADEVFVDGNVDEAWEKLRDLLWPERSGDRPGSVKALFREEDPETVAWLDDYLARIQTGERQDKRLVEAATIFVDGAVVHERIAWELNNFLGGESGIEESYDDRKQKPFDLKTITAALDCNRREAADLVAFLALFKEKQELEIVLRRTKEGGFEYLERLGISRQDAETVTRVMKDEDHVDFLVKTLLDRVTPLLVEHMTPEALLSFTDSMRISCRQIDPRFMRDRFANPEQQAACRQSILALSAKDMDRALWRLQAYEYLFGPIDRREFLAFFPDWEHASGFSYMPYLLRFGLVESGRGARSSVSTGPRPLDLAVLGELPREPRVQVVTEERLLQLRSEEPQRTDIPRVLFPYVTKKVRGAAAIERGAMRLPPEPETTLFVPLDRSEGQYLAVIEPALRAMGETVEMGERVRIFLGTIWPQFLIASADAAPPDTIGAQVQAAIQLLDSSIRDDFSSLMADGNAVGRNQARIERTAARLRNSATLHEYGVYVHTQILRRQRNTPRRETVHLISGMAYEIDEREEHEVSGKTSDMLFLGRRIDHLAEEMPAMGFRYTGDGHGVVLKEMVRQATDQSVMPYLMDGTEYAVLAGETIHPLHGLVREALRRDLGQNPDARRRERIYENRYQSTQRHELRHAQDEAARRHAHITSPTDRRVASEINAYLANITDEEQPGRVFAPLVDFVDIIQLYVSYRENPLVKLRDLFGIYERATREILLQFARRLQVNQVNEQNLTRDPLDACALILGKALEVGSTRISELAKEILAETMVVGGPMTMKEERLGEVGMAMVPRALPAAIEEEPVAMVGAEEKLTGSLKGRLMEVARALIISFVASGAVNDFGKKAEPPPAPAPAALVEPVVEPIAAKSAVQDKGEDARAAEETLTRRGLWGYAEHLLGSAGFTFERAGEVAYARYGGETPRVIFEKQKRIYYAAIDTLTGHLGGLLRAEGKYGVSPDFNPEQMEA